MFKTQLDSFTFFHFIVFLFTREVIEGERRLKRGLFKEQEDALLREKEKDETFPGLPADRVTRQEKIPVPRKLPPLNGPKMA